MAIIQLRPITERVPPPFAPDRRCPYPDCTTTLSRYNEGPCCEVHSSTAFAAELLNEMEKRAA